jgi:hypothetical protein
MAQLVRFTLPFRLNIAYTGDWDSDYTGYSNFSSWFNAYTDSLTGVTDAHHNASHIISGVNSGDDLVVVNDYYQRQSGDERSVLNNPTSGYIDIRLSMIYDPSEFDSTYDGRIHKTAFQVSLRETDPSFLIIEDATIESNMSSGFELQGLKGSTHRIIRLFADAFKHPTKSDWWPIINPDGAISGQPEVNITLVMPSDPVGLCLTVKTDTAGGKWTGHPLCPDVYKVIDQECTGNVPKGTIVNITAEPDANYKISNWDFQTTTGETVIRSFNGDPNSSETVTFKQKEVYGDVTVTVSFVPVDCELTIQVEDGLDDKRGTITLLEPDKSPDTTWTKLYKTFSIEADKDDSTNIRVTATPDPGLQVSGWTLDGADWPSVTNDPNSVSFTTLTKSARIIIVNFELTDCEAVHQLTVSVSPPSGGNFSPLNKKYCDGGKASISPEPANGWIFDHWQHDKSPNISLSGENLNIVMKKSWTNIVAVFRQVSGVDVENSLFYCPSDDYKNNIVAFDFTNSLNDNNPSVDNNYHFRLNFYSDVDKTKLIYSAFSLSDNKRWFLDDGSFSQLSSEGVDVDLSETVSIVYDPEILPSQIMETQKPHLINSETVVYEKPLIGGIKYYVEIQAYEVRTNTVLGIKTISLELSSDRIDSYYWNYNKDKNNWLCSGQGKADLKVCGGFEQAINSSVDSNSEGTFKIVWQGRKESNASNIYSAVWDSNRDILYSSGQGLYDVLEMDEGNNPVIITDPALNFYISGTTSDNIKYKECATSSINTSGGGVVPPAIISESFCYPGELTLLSSSYDEIKMRIYGEDTNGSLVINDEKVVPVVSKRNIRLDVDGIVGAYAVRVRNMEDPEWGDWINIDSELYINAGETITADDSLHDAYRIDNNRFLVGWNINNYNGLRRICCQVLTMYGISNTFCIEVLANFDVPQHVFKFYTATPHLPGLPSDTPPGNEFPKYNGQYVLSITNATIDGPEGGKMVYFDAEFSDEISTTGVAYNLIQQGINDKRNQNFTVIGDKGLKLSGEFEIFNNDGIFNKDGASFIEIVDIASKPCGSDKRDKYNSISYDIDEISNVDLLPEEVYQKYQRDSLSKPIDINKFKQNYDNDDANFKFGNPGYYRK